LKILPFSLKESNIAESSEHYLNIEQGISNYEGLFFILYFIIHNSLFDILRFKTGSQG